MIIGNGVLANAVRDFDREDLIFFASGVSNSLETRTSEFEREIDLLHSIIEKFPEKKLIYFSTCSIYDSSKTKSPYVLHKLNIEKMISENCDQYAIFRVGNAVGKGGNMNTLINFLNNAIETGKKIQIHSNARRVFIGVNDIALFISQHIDSIENTVFNLVYPYQFSLEEVIAPLEKHLGKKAVCEVTNEGAYYNINFEESTKAFFDHFSPEEYINKLFITYL
ncbi:NAD-dependent epimerase/dehydratase family protein [Chryseobacterium sp. L7]|uniref:NAD-dependent epimerase/dehydratase family protein n=1 Tax=Chryseobacterium endalhagicum TaxID=2797638 RepID=A0ABS1QI87_9FLAO|nr:NAD-dependent epimerase/dehydratase family protein [Chryseobacterium endalhagicum]MBL1221997.1 NAD-dependent epimerase/dehydratase family protein [Chryseobacterium endalhagicum]